jgi:outer membrane protein, multidrug efflux system
MGKMKHIIYIAIGVSLLLSSCKTVDVAVTDIDMPQAYYGAADTTNIADFNWRQYFDDTHLLQLIDVAVVNNFELQEAMQRIEMARSGVRFSKGELFPKVDGSIFAGTNKYAKYTEGFAGNSTTEFEGKTIPNPVQDYYLGLTSAWEPDVWGKLRNQRKSAVSNFLASIDGKNLVLSNLVADIAISYYELIALDNEQEIISQTIKKQEEALDFVKAHKEVGRANELAVQQFQIELLNTLVLEKEIIQQISEVDNRINFLLGRFPQFIVREKESLFRELPQEILSGIPSQLLLNRPDIREAEQQVHASKFDLKTAKAAFFPNLNIVSTLGFQAFNPEFLFSTPTSIGYSALGSLFAPIINRNALEAQFSTAKASQLSAIYNYQKTILNGYVEVVNELSNVQNLQGSYSLKEQQSNVSEKSVETSTELFKNAKANYLEVLIAQQNSLEAKLELIELRKRQKVAKVNIYKALGGGWK